MQVGPDEPRLILFFFESPVPIMLPDQATWGFVLEDDVPWLRDVPRAPVSSVEPLTDPDELGKAFVSFRFWQHKREAEPTFPSSELMATVRSVLNNREDVRPGRLGIVGLGDYTESESEPKSSLEAADIESDAVGEKSGLEQDVTVIEAVTPLLPSERQSPVLEALQRIMASMTEFTRVYRLGMRVRMPVVTYEMLPATEVVWLTRDPFDSRPEAWDSEVELLMFPERLSVRSQHPQLDEEGIDRLAAYWTLWRQGHPIIPYSERTMEARLALELYGDYGATVTQCQTSLEVLLDGLIQLLLWEEQADPSGVAETVYASSLQKRVRAQLPSRLGGNWTTNIAMREWSAVLAPLRHRTVHGAYRPTRDEAIHALDTVSDIDDFVRGRLASRRNDYPRTTLLILGRPGLERLGAWTGKIRRFAEAADEEPNWINSFRTWRDALNVAREATGNM